MKSHEFIRSHFRKYSFYFDILNRYSKTYKNFLTVLIKAKKNEFPIFAVLKNNQEKKFVSQRDLGATSAGFGDMYEFKDDVLIIKKDNLPEIKMFGAKNNGDIGTVFFQEGYQTLPVNDRTVIDIGASIGDTAIYFALKGAKKVIALEPFLSNYELAKKNTIENKLDSKIHLLLAGCSNKNEKIIISETEVASQSDISKSKQGNEISLMSLEEILNQFNVDSAILKMDCEGCEYDSILDSPKEVLQKFDFIFIEYHYGYINLKEKLEQCGFEVSISPPTFFNNPHAKIPKTYLGDMYAKKICN